MRLERLEADVDDLKAALQIVHMSGQAASTTSSILPHTSPSVILPAESEAGVHGSPHDRSVVGPASERLWKQPSMNGNAVDAGLITWEQATFWYRRFVCDMVAIRKELTELSASSVVAYVAGPPSKKKRITDINSIFSFPYFVQKPIPSSLSYLEVIFSLTVSSALAVGLKKGAIHKPTIVYSRDFENI